MNILAGGFSSFINAVFADWQILLFVIAVVLLLLVIIFRKVKLVPWILGALCAGIFIALIAMLISAAVNWNLQQLLDFCVKWVPTILFTLIIFFATVLGILRGLRKSLILLLHEVCIGVVCIVAYALLVRLPQVDAFMLKVVDAFMGGSGSLQNTLGVTAPCEGLKDVFVEWLPGVVNKLNTDFGLLLSGSKAYIYTLADLVYHIVFALLLYIIYVVLDFILYIIYHCCYSERKYKRKRNEKFALNKVDSRYRRHSVGGGVVGAVRGLAIALLSVSFLGSTLYVVAGRGDGNMKDYDFGNKDVNEYYSLYRSIESYGTYGIFKVLNCVSSSEDVPYYLFAADLVFSGELDDEEFGVSDHIVFREELDAYTDFARDTMNLLVKYGGEEIRPLINGTATDSAFDTVVNVMSDDMFRAEFDDLIGEFDAKTYIINFAMSLVNTTIAKIDDVQFAQNVSKDNRELLKVLFTKGYLSDVIPDEAEKKASRSSDEVQPYINVSKLVNKKDVQIIFNVVLDLLTNKTSGVNDVINLVGDILPSVQKLSLLSQNRAEELDPVLGRLYCYAANRYLTEEGSEGVTYASVYEENVAWIDEINKLIDVADSGLQLYRRVYREGAEAKDTLLDIFDKSSENYDANVKNYDDICKQLYRSKLLGKTLASSYICKTVTNALDGMLSGVYIPQNIKYENTYDESGKVVEAGELYNLLSGIGNIGKSSDLLSLLKTFDKDNDLDTLLDMLSDTLTVMDNDGNTVKHYLTKSKILRSVMSVALINYGEKYVYVPMAARETDGDGNPVKFITEEEISILFDNFDELADLISPALKEGGDIKKSLTDFVKSDLFDKLLDESRIFEGTAGKLLADELANDATIVIPARLKTDYEGWVSVGGKSGELKKVLDAIDLVGVDVAQIINGDFDTKELKDKVLNMKLADFEKAIDSKVLHYTLTKQLVGDGADGVKLGDVKIIVPNGAISKSLVDENDVLNGLITKSQLNVLFKAVQGFELNDNTDVKALLTHLVKNKQAVKESMILSASLAGTIVGNGDIADMLKLPVAYGADGGGSYEKLKNYNSSNAWKNELPMLIDALDEVFGISAGEEFSLDEEVIKEKLSSLFRNFNLPSAVKKDVKRVSVCCASEIVKNCITERLDELLSGKIDREITASAKSGGYYTEAELSSLSDALYVFDIDMLNISGDELTKKVKEMLFKLNEPMREGGEKTKLQAIYPSRIFSGMFGKELDKVLLDSEPAEGQSSEPMIEGKALSYIKGSDMRYSEEDVAQLITSLNAFGINEYKDIETVKFDSIKDKREQLPVICASRIVCAIFTKQVKANNSLNVDHPNAYLAEPYKKNVQILRYDEIDSLVALYSGAGTETVEDMYFEQLTFGALEESLYKENGEVKSYLVLSAVSESLLGNVNLLIDRQLVDGYKCIEESEVRALLNAFIALHNAGLCSDNLNDWIDGGGKFGYPQASVRSVMLQSSIARAKVSEQLISENTKEDNACFVNGRNVSDFEDYRTRSTRHALSERELTAIFAAIDVINSSGEYKLPKIDTELLKTCSENDIYTLFASDLLRYKVCDCVLEAAGGSLTYINEKALNLNGFTEANKRVLNPLQVIDFLNELKSH